LNFVLQARKLFKKELTKKRNRIIFERKFIFMSISDLFDSEFKSRNKGHFSAIVRVAFAEGVLAPEEKAFLDKLAGKLDISKDEYEEILENPLKYPINPPYLHTQRLERLYDLSRMVHVDHQLGDRQDVLLRKFALALGFTPGNVNYIVDKALALIDEKVDLDTFVYEMTHMNK
jgi:uncharacterized tellurite resistance protein B-like protein